jgi:hypothetical protein
MYGVRPDYGARLRRMLRGEPGREFDDERRDLLLCSSALEPSDQLFSKDRVCATGKLAVPSVPK